MAGLLVSVRSAEEAIAAVTGGASVVDVKEPARGPLGRADPGTWRLVREAVPPSIPVSVALGEIGEARDLDPGSLRGLAYRKVGLARSGPGWLERWHRLIDADPGGPAWVAVAYLDWEAAEAPDPRAVLRAAVSTPGCRGILLDTWDKARAGRIEPTEAWRGWVGEAQGSGRFVALAGGLDLAAIDCLGSLGPDLFAVRGAACGGSDRLGSVDPERVARLVEAAGHARLSRWRSPD